MLPDLDQTSEDILDAVLDLIPTRLARDADIVEVEPAVPGYAWASAHGRLHVGLRLDGQMLYAWDVPGHGSGRHVAAVMDEVSQDAFMAAADAYSEASEDPWDTDAEHGYADYRIVGDDSWEDQKGMADLKATLKIPDNWFLVKVVNFHDACPTGDARRSLASIETWLSEHCEHPYRRVGWSSGCSTKVGVAFESQNEAFFFFMRWR